MFPAETFLADMLNEDAVISDVFLLAFNPPPKPASLRSVKNISFFEMQEIANDLQFVRGGKYKDLYELLHIPQTASTEKVYQAAEIQADAVRKMPKSNPKADVMNRLARKYLLYFKDEEYRRSYDIALRRLPFDMLAETEFDLYADSFRSSRRTDGTIWNENLIKTQELGFTKKEAEYLVYEYYCVMRKCPPPVFDDVLFSETPLLSPYGIS